VRLIYWWKLLAQPGDGNAETQFIDCFTGIEEVGNGLQSASPAWGRVLVIGILSFNIV
jgi:hypothetical protein